MGYIWARGYLKGHEKKKRNGKTKDDLFYKTVIDTFRINNGHVFCENCGVIIENPTGGNVSHIISKGADTRLYHHVMNQFILCKIGDNKLDWGNSCHLKWENGDRKEMRIYNEAVIRKEYLYQELLKKNNNE